MENISGSRRMCLETTVMWENNTVLLEHWLVSHSDYLPLCLLLLPFFSLPLHIPNTIFSISIQIKLF